MVNVKALRRLYEAAQRDGQPERFHQDLAEGLRKKELRFSDFSIRGLFENFVEDGRELVGLYDPRQRQPDISKAKEVLGWEPKVQLREGLIQTIAYFDKLLAQNETWSLRSTAAR